MLRRSAVAPPMDCPVNLGQCPPLRNFIMPPALDRCRIERQSSARDRLERIDSLGLRSRHARDGTQPVLGDTTFGGKPSNDRLPFHDLLPTAGDAGYWLSCNPDLTTSWAMLVLSHLPYSQNR